MKSRMIASHVVVALLAFALGYAIHSSQTGTGHGPIARPDDPVAALAEILQISDAHARTQALLDYFAAADPAWAERVRAEIEPTESKIVLDEIGETLFASWWARSNPKAAFEQRVEPAWRNRNPWLREVMLAWVASDPTRAAEAAATLPQNPDRGIVEAVRVLVDHWWDAPAAPDSKPLVDLIRKLEVVPRAGAIQRLIELSIEHRGIDATEQFVESLPEEDDIGVSVQQEVLARFGQALVEHDVDRAILWANEHGQGRKGSGILRHLAFSWGQKDGPRAMQWAMGLPDSMERPAILYRVWLSFRQSRPEEAAQWLLAQGPSEVLEGVYSRYLSGLAIENKTQEALEIAMRATDAPVRDRLVTAVGMGWAQTDPDAARKWLDTIELPPELEERIRKAADASRPHPMVTAPTRG
jgi:hypothetical protein